MRSRRRMIWLPKVCFWNSIPHFMRKHLVATGHPRFRDSDAQGPLSLDADEISAGLRTDGSVDSIVASGNVHGTRNSPVGEDGIEAGRVQMDLATRQNVASSPYR